MANLTNKLFGLHNASTVDGTDSRTQGDENLNALAGSMNTSFPNLSDTACTKTGAALNDTTEALASETISGTWTFVQNIVASLAGSISAYALRIIRNGNDVFFVEQGGRVVIDIDATAGGRTALEITDQGGSRTADFIRVTDNLNAEKFVVNSSGGVTAGGDVTILGATTTTGQIVANGGISGATSTFTELTSTGNMNVTGNMDAGGFVSGDTWRVGNATAQPGVGGVPDAVHNAIEVFDESGTSLGYIYAFATAS